jgi:SAM-dependent methyltransferase
MRELNAIGSNVDSFACPFCGCTDRERHLKLFMMSTGISEQLSHADVIHFAPEEQLAKWIASLGPARYILADIAPKSEGIVRIDIESIPYADESFDFVIANHVLEHVENLDASTQEIARVLKTGGKAILQTPWCKGIETTIEDKTVVSPGARLHLYGQDDHVRLFGRDIFSRISGDWLKPQIVEHSQALAQYSAEKYGLNEKEPFMVFVKS